MAWTPDFQILGIVVAGDLGDQTIWTDRHGRKVYSKKNWPDKPPSALQRVARDRFREAISAWRSLTAEMKETWELLSLKSYASCTGHNLFVHACLSQDQSRVITLMNQTGIEVELPVYIPPVDPNNGEFF
jgi:hypothetical protein